jgi:protein TonB
MVPPAYPRLASQARIRGEVVLDAVLTVEGKVDQIRVLSGHPLLIQAAIDCVRKWEYEPTLLNGMPVAVVLTVRIHFNQRPVS